MASSWRVFFKSYHTSLVLHVNEKDSATMGIAHLTLNLLVKKSSQNLHNLIVINITRTATEENNLFSRAFLYLLENGEKMLGDVYDEEAKLVIP